MTGELSVMEPKLVAKADAEPLDVFGVRVDVLLTAEDTHEAFSTYYLECERGAGAPDHLHHREDETFFVIEGEFEFRMGDDVRRASAGSEVFLPRGVAHKFQCLSETGRLFGMAVPGGHERFFRDADALMRSGGFNPQSAAELCKRHGMEVFPPAA